MNKLQKIEELRTKFLAELDALKKECEVSKLWKPNKGELCFSLNVDGTIYDFNWADSSIDKRVYERGLIFRTEQEARDHDNYRLAYMRVTRKLRELEGDEVIDWSDDNTKKHFFSFDYRAKKLALDWNYYYQGSQLERHSTQQAIEWVIKHMADDCKCILGVK